MVVPVDLQSLPALGVGTQVKSGQTAPVSPPVDLTQTRINTVDFNSEPAPAPAPAPGMQPAAPQAIRGLEALTRSTLRLRINKLAVALSALFL